MNDFPRIAPPADGLALAMATARSRRLRKASASSGASALALTLVAVLAGTSGRSTLSEQPTPEQPAVVVNVVPDGQSKTVDQSAKPNVLSAASGSSTARSGSSAAALGRPTGLSPSPAFEPSDRDTARTSGRRDLPSVSYKAGPIKREDSSGLNIPTCAVQGDGQSYTTCPQGNATDRGDGTFTFSLDLCNNDTKPVTLTFPDADEVDFAVYSTGPNDSYTPVKQLWRWSDTHPRRSDAHTHVVARTACTTWTFTYTLVDGAGRALPKGSYVMRAHLLATAPAKRTVPDTTFTVS